MTIHIRTSGDPSTVIPALRAEVAALDPDMPLSDVRTMGRHLGLALLPARLTGTVLAVFGILGLVLAAVGIYGVMAYVVAQRTNEIGVRMALGATRGNVVSMVLRRAGVLMLLGLVIGAAGSWYLSASVKSFLFEVQPNDVGIFVAALGVLASAGLLASALPARRAAAVDPLVALRSE